MLKSKFIDIIKTFSKGELKQFRDFLRSPFHNANQNVVKLFDIVRKYAPEFDSASLEKENLFKKLYPGKNYNDTVMRILSSDMLSLGEEFLTLKRSAKDKYGMSLILLQELRDRGLDSLYQRNFKNIEGQIRQVEDARTRYFANFELEIVNVDYFLRKEKQHLISGNILERAENLIYFMLIELTRHVHDIIINERTFNAKFEFNLVYEFLNSFDFEALMEKIKLGRPKHYPIISIYYNLLRALMVEENESYYDNFKDSVESYFPNLSHYETNSILNDMESCCLNRMKYNVEKYRDEIFHVYELMLTSKAYVKTGTEAMSVQRFKNIFIAAINLKKAEWAGNFADKYLEKLQPEFRDNMHYYSRALLGFVRGDFQKSLGDLSKVKHESLALKMDVKSWALKIYYELGYYEPAFSLMDSYKHFLSKNRSLSGHFRERNLNFLKYTGDLIKFKTGMKKPDLTYIEHYVRKTVNIVHKDWLIQKINEFH